MLGTGKKWNESFPGTRAHHRVKAKDQYHGVIKKTSRSKAYTALWNCTTVCDMIWLYHLYDINGCMMYNHIWYGYTIYLPPSGGLLCEHHKDTQMESVMQSPTSTKQGLISHLTTVSVSFTHVTFNQSSWNYLVSVSEVIIP